MSGDVMSGYEMSGDLLVYKTFIVCNNCTELSQRLISLYNAGAEKFKNTCNKRNRKRKRNLNIITARNQVP
jgi:hypothetical protein